MKSAAALSSRTPRRAPTRRESDTGPLATLSRALRMFAPWPATAPGEAVTLPHAGMRGITPGDEPPKRKCTTIPGTTACAKNACNTAACVMLYTVYNNFRKNIAFFA